MNCNNVSIRYFFLNRLVPILFKLQKKAQYIYIYIYIHINTYLNILKKKIYLRIKIEFQISNYVYLYDLFFLPH